ncbi:hypothetical protein PT2222_120067 [Paraburkholderia tropica]
MKILKRSDSDGAYLKTGHFTRWI